MCVGVHVCAHVCVCMKEKIRKGERACVCMHAYILDANWFICIGGGGGGLTESETEIAWQTDLSYFLGHQQRT